jgi:exonuclease SbcC
VTKQREETSRLEARKVALEEIDKTDFSERADKLVLQYKAAKLKLIEAKQYDLEGIKKSWSDYSRQEKERDDRIAPLKSEKTELEKQLWAASEDVDKWNRLSDNTCPECEQDVSVELAVRRRVHYQKEEDKLKKKIAKIEKQLKEFEKNIIEPPEITVQQAEVTNARYEDLASAVSEAKEAIRDLAKEKEEADEKQDERKNDITNLEGQIQANRDEITLSEKALDRQEDKLEKSKPGVTLNEALAIRSQYDAKSGEVAVLEESLNNLDQQKKSEKESCEDEVRKLREEENPVERVISDLEKDLEDIRSQYSGAEKKVNLFDSLISHIEYIRKSYSDRRKIKAFIVKKMISFLNEMIYYHLRALQCDFTLEFNEFLQAKTGTYPYELWSGGERRRIDLALMFATYKLNKSIHGQSSNIIVFDEVERSLDKSGMRALTELIFREFSDKSVVVISHTDELRDVFPSKIVVKRASRHNSRIEEIR